MEKAIELFGNAAGYWRKLGNLPMLADSLTSMSLYLNYLGKLDASREAAEEAFAISTEINNGWGQSFSLSTLGLNLWLRGQWSQAINALQRSADSAEESGYHFGIAFAKVFLGYVYIDLGVYAKAVDETRIAFETFADKQYRFRISGIASMVTALAHQGSLSAARDYFQEIADLQFEDAFNLSQVFIAHNTIALAEKNYAMLLESASQSLPALESHKLRPFIAENLYYLGLAHLHLDRLDEAEQAFRHSQELARQIGLRRIEWKILGGLGQLAVKRGDSEKALAFFSAEEDQIQALAGQINDANLKDSFLAQWENVKLEVGEI